jgi:quinol-cytochrome oxidoreductase complex cytochrome b subunit
MGYVLPWGQMSFWAATVITNIFGAIPVIGEGLAEWLWGGYAVDNPTLQRFYSLHYLFPFLIAGVVVLHIWALHVPGNNNPIGIDPKGKQDTVPFHPYYTVKDAFVMVLFVMLFSFFVFYAPNALGHPDNFIPANPMQTPPHIVPEWYLLPFYAILRSVTFDFLGLSAKFLGVIAMFASIGMMFILPWLDTSKVRSLRYRPLMQWFFWLFLVDCIVLGWVGAQTPDLIVLKLGTFNFDVAAVGLIATTWYFVHFLVITPLIGLIEVPREIPESISQSVLGSAAAKKAAETRADALARQQA